MYKSLTTIIALLTVCMSTFAQINSGGEPFSFRNSKLDLDYSEVVVAKPDMVAITAQDEQREMDGSLKLNGRIIETDLDLDNAGSWTILENEDRVWRLSITAPEALATELFYDEFELPPGAILHVYDPMGSQLLGGFTAFNNHASGLFTTDLITGETCILELYEPASVAGQSLIHISGVGYSYRNVPGIGAKAQDCEVDVNCSPEGDDWTDQRGSVVRIRTVSSQGIGWCTGVVMNNTDENCAPYVLTALHCGDDASNANFLQWKFYFNFQRPGCEMGTAFANQSMTGCTDLANSNDGGGASGSDFLLVELEDDIPIWFGAYYAGWDATGNGSSNGVCIHHPDGDEKKISTYTQQLVSATWQSANGAHWRARWSATQNGHGVTEGGSSGSPIFNTDKRVIGTLTGGLSYCNSVVPGGQNQPDFYGKMDWHWDGNWNPTTDLKDILDPGNTGATTFDGAFNPCNFVGIEEYSLDQISIYPNPSTGVLNIDIGSAERSVERVEVFNTVGALVFESQITSNGIVELDLSTLVNGSYYVSVWNSNSERITKPIVLTR